MKGSTAGARHLAESARWLAWWTDLAPVATIGTLFECALRHWDAAQLARWVDWVRRLPA